MGTLLWAPKTFIYVSLGVNSKGVVRYLPLAGGCNMCSYIIVSMQYPKGYAIYVDIYYVDDVEIATR